MSHPTMRRERQFVSRNLEKRRKGEGQTEPYLCPSVVKRVAVKSCDYGCVAESVDFAGSEMPRSSAASLRKRSSSSFLGWFLSIHATA